MPRLLGCLVAMLPVSAAAQVTASEWRSHGRDAAETRYSPLASINTSNIKRLVLVWSYDTQTVRGLEGTPLVVNGVLYGTASWLERAGKYVLTPDFVGAARPKRHRWKHEHRPPRTGNNSLCQSGGQAFVAEAIGEGGQLWPVLLENATRNDDNSTRPIEPLDCLGV